MEQVGIITPFIEEASKGSARALATAIAYLLVDGQGRVNRKRYLELLKAVIHAGNDLFTCVETFLTRETGKLIWEELRKQGLPVVTEQMGKNLEILMHAIEPLQQADRDRLQLAKIKKTLVTTRYPSQALAA